MYLSKFQKEIVRKIANEEIKTVLDFLLQFNLILEIDQWRDEGEKAEDLFNGAFSINNKNYKINNKDDAYSRIIDYKKVINLLLKADLIAVEKMEDMEIVYLCTYDIFAKVFNIINSLRNDLVVTYNEIKNFEKDFLTPQERAERKQLWIPIIVAIATVILSSVINYFIYTKEREVFIKNVKAFQDTVKVKLIEDKDSLRIENK